MNLTISSVTFEFYWGRYAYFCGGGREVILKFSSDCPFGFFGKERSDQGLQVWGLGMELTTNPI